MIDLEAIEARAKAAENGTMGMVVVVHDDVPALVAEVRRLRKLTQDWRAIARAEMPKLPNPSTQDEG